MEEGEGEGEGEEERKGEWEGGRERVGGKLSLPDLYASECTRPMNPPASCDTSSPSLFARY